MVHSIITISSCHIHFWLPDSEPIVSKQFFSISLSCEVRVNECHKLICGDSTCCTSCIEFGSWFRSKNLFDCLTLIDHGLDSTADGFEHVQLLLYFGESNN